MKVAAENVARVVTLYKTSVAPVLQVGGATCLALPCFRLVLSYFCVFLVLACPVLSSSCLSFLLCCVVFSCLVGACLVLTCLCFVLVLSCFVLSSLVLISSYSFLSVCLMLAVSFTRLVVWKHCADYYFLSHCCVSFRVFAATRTGCLCRLFSSPFQVKGFCGAKVFSDRGAGTVQSLTLWESWGDLETAVGDKRYAKVRLSEWHRSNCEAHALHVYVLCRPKLGDRRLLRVGGPSMFFFMSSSEADRHRSLL